MSKIFNLNAIRELMQDPPRGQRLYVAFNDFEWDLLTDQQLLNLEQIVKDQYQEFKKVIDNAIKLREL